MTAKQEMVMNLLSKDTIKKVKEQFKSGVEILNNDAFDMTFRLYKSKANNINLEIPIQIKTDNGEEQEIDEIGRGIIQNFLMIFKPIGFYTQKKGFLTTEIEITIIKEFEEELEYLIDAGIISFDIKVNKLSLVDNALIAAFSMEAYLNAEKHKDCSFLANGLDMDIYMTFDNEYPQSFLNDKYGLAGHIGAYFVKIQKPRIDMNVIYENAFQKLYNMSLLTAYKKL
jgi:hypothetical protein